MKAKIKLLLSCFLLLTIVTVITSCGDDDDSKPKPTASFTVSSTTADVGEEITFTNTSEDATSYVWSFGDGTTSTVESPSKTYSAAGTFEVTLAATGSGGSDQATETITVSVANLGELYFIDYTDAKIAKFAISTPETVTDVLDIADKNGLGMAYDATNQKIYFSGYDLDDIGGIWTVNPDGTGVTNIVTDLYDPYGIALNVGASKLYITDFGDEVGAIYQTSLTGTGKVTVVENVGESGYVAVSLDLVNNKMYYFAYDNENLYRANLDGTNQEVVVAGAWGYSILVDAANSKVYYNDRNSASGDLKSASLTGTNVTTVDATASRIYGIVISNNKLYWSSRENGSVYQANLDGSDKVTIKSGLSSPRAIFVK